MLAKGLTMGTHLLHTEHMDNTPQPPTELLPLSKHERANWTVWLREGARQLKQRRMPTHTTPLEYAIRQLHSNRK